MNQPLKPTSTYEYDTKIVDSANWLYFFKEGNGKIVAILTLWKMDAWTIQTYLSQDIYFSKSSIC